MVYTDWESAQADADKLGMAISATGTKRPDGSWTDVQYFLTEVAADPYTVSDEAFEVLHGRPMGGYEKTIAQIAKRMSVSS